VPKPKKKHHNQGIRNERIAYSYKEPQHPAWSDSDAVLWIWTKNIRNHQQPYSIPMSSIPLSISENIKAL